MKIGIISDTHGSLARWDLAYTQYLHDADLILHAGDVLYHGPRNPVLPDYDPAQLAERLTQCPVPILFAKGNCDAAVDASVLGFPLLAPYGYAFLSGKRIVFTHGDSCLSDAEKDAMAGRLQADLFITGHTHIPVLEKRGKTWFLNPGSPALPKQEGGQGSVALLTNHKIEVLAIDTGAILLSDTIA